MKTLLDSIEIQSEYIGNAAWRPFSSFHSDKWEVRIRRGCLDYEDGITVEFYLGEAHEGREPELGEVIFSLLSDARAGELGFEDFCGEFGYDTDSRRAFAIWEACKATREKLGVLFSPEEIEQLEVEFQDY